MQKKVLILGGYGNTGFLIARLLLQEGDVQLIIAGRNSSRAQRAVDELNREFHTDRASSKQVDAANTDSLEATFEVYLGQQLICPENPQLLKNGVIL